MKKITPLNNKTGKLILVTAMTSNKYGIGKTTMSIGLADALNKLGHKTVLALREPSMGPVFGIKGGATGGGLSKIEPSTEINLHFNGDFHAIAQANNLLASIIDNHIFQGNELNIDTNKIFFKRCLDINDRSLREIEYSINDKKVKTGFVITAASEVMAILALSKTLDELKSNLGNILIGLNTKGDPVFAKELNAEESMTVLLKDAFKPNEAKTIENNMALVHLGPFANIAHGCNSIVATETALSMGEYCVTEAGFGSDLGAEKFLNIKSRLMNKQPDVVILVVVIKVIKEHGNGDLIEGFNNIKRHINIIKNVFGLNLVIAINKHSDDLNSDISILQDLCKKEKVEAVIANPYNEGYNGCLLLAERVIKESTQAQIFKFTYDMNDSISQKIEKIASKIYGAKRVDFTELAMNKLKLIKKFNMENFFVNIAKTQFSFSDNKNLIGAPNDFIFTINDIEIRSGAKMIVAIAGNILLMPGLSKTSNYLNIKIDNNENIFGI